MDGVHMNAALIRTQGHKVNAARRDCRAGPWQASAIRDHMRAATYARRDHMHAAPALLPVACERTAHT